MWVLGCHRGGIGGAPLRLHQKPKVPAGPFQRANTTSGVGRRNRRGRPGDVLEKQDFEHIPDGLSLKTGSTCCRCGLDSCARVGRWHPDRAISGHAYDIARAQIKYSSQTFRVVSRSLSSAFVSVPPAALPRSSAARRYSSFHRCQNRRSNCIADKQKSRRRASHSSRTRCCLHLKPYFPGSHRLLHRCTTIRFR